MANKYSFLTQKNEVNQNYKKVINTLCGCVIEAKSNKLYLKNWTKNRGRYALIDGDYIKMLQVLNELKIKYDLGNDSPKCGVTGDYIIIKMDRRQSGIKYILSHFVYNKKYFEYDYIGEITL